jgi:hypothetical protein
MYGNFLNLVLKEKKVFTHLLMFEKYIDLQKICFLTNFLRISYDNFVFFYHIFILSFWGTDNDQKTTNITADIIFKMQ